VAKKRKRKSAAARKRRASVARRSQPRAAVKAAAVDFASEYSYVVSDLRRLGILAVAMFATLIVLALLLG